GHVDHRGQTARHEDRVVLAYVHIGQFLGLLHRGPTFSHQEGEVVGIAGQVERVEKRRVASQAGKVDLVSRTVEFRVRVCDFGQKVPCPPVVPANDVSVRNDEQHFFRHDRSLLGAVGNDVGSEQTQTFFATSQNRGRSRAAHPSGGRVPPAGP